MIARAPCDRGVAAGAGRDSTLRATGTWVLVASILGSSMVFIDGTVVNVVLPLIQNDLHATAVELQWIVVGYSLFLSSLMLLGGVLGDRFGRRRIFVGGIVLFAGASAWCGVAHSAGTLIAARALQGIGSALLTPGSLALIGAAYDEKSRPRAVGLWSSFTAITAALGPPLGGWIAEHASWRWVFYINIPLALSVLAITLTRVPESRDDRNAGRIDWIGAALNVAALGGISYGLTFAVALGWGASSVVISLIAGVIAAIAFAFAESRSASPLMPLDLLASREFLGVNLQTLLLYGALAVAMFYLPFDLIQVQGYSPAAAGSALLPFILLVFLLSGTAGSVVQRYGERLPLVAGPLLAAAGLALFAVPDVGGSYWTTFFPGIVVLGLGMAFTVAPLTSTVMESAGADRVGAASGVNNAVSRIAGTLAIAAFGLLMAASFTHALRRELVVHSVPSHVAADVLADRQSLAAAAAPPATAPSVRAQAHAAVLTAYVWAFRIIVLCAALLALGAAIVGAATIKPRAP